MCINIHKDSIVKAKIVGRSAITYSVIYVAIFCLHQDLLRKATLVGGHCSGDIRQLLCRVLSKFLYSLTSESLYFCICANINARIYNICYCSKWRMFCQISRCHYRCDIINRCANSNEDIAVMKYVTTKWLLANLMFLFCNVLCIFMIDW